MKETKLCCLSEKFMHVLNNVGLLRSIKQKLSALKKSEKLMKKELFRLRM